MCWFRRKDRSEKFYPYGFAPYGRRKMTRAQQDDFIKQLLAAKTSNELAILAGLKPIRGRSGPRLFY